MAGQTSSCDRDLQDFSGPGYGSCAACAGPLAQSGWNKAWKCAGISTTKERSIMLIEQSGVISLSVAEFGFHRGAQSCSTP